MIVIMLTGIPNDQLYIMSEGSSKIPIPIKGICKCYL